MKGSTYHRCYCRDAETGKPLGKSCPKAGNRKHGSYSIRQELPNAKDGTRRSFNRAGYETLKEAQADLDHVRGLLALGKEDPDDLALVAELLVKVADEKAQLPDIEETRNRLKAGQDLSTRVTVGEWLDTWLAGKKIRKSGITRYECDVRVHLKPRIGHIRVDRLRVSTLAEMFTAIADANEEILENNALRHALKAELATVPIKGLENRARRRALRAELAEMPPFRRTTGAATRQRIRATLRTALNEAIPEGLITLNPAAHVKLDPAARPNALVWTPERAAQWQATGVKPSPVMVWTPQQTGAFLDFVAADRLYAMWHVIAFRGLRRGEACGQPWSETNLDNSSLTVTAQLVQDGWEVQESDPKTDGSFRTVALDDDTVAVLRRHRERQQKDRDDWGSAWKDTGRVFTNEDGSWLHPGKVTEMFERLVTASGLPPIRLHDLRHGAATLALAGGVDMKVVSEMLGHSSIKITSDIYTSVLPEIAKDAAEAAAKLVPLQRKTEAEAHAKASAKAAAEAEKAKRKAAKKARSKAKKTKR
ncbi:tyrosine-type recombinase/integrase [Kitasatospora sp. NPDC087861]|uniref:tyrosine-type recombinase/integrase n=1 Tax=Kitasatospora sp. NPDC087861 TaxID=3364070 RepID=UPI0038265824